MPPFNDQCSFFILAILLYHFKAQTFFHPLVPRMRLSEPLLRRLDPERWLRSEATQGAHDTSAFLPFGTGPRFCPGRFLALLEIKGVISMLCRNFELERAGSGPVEVDWQGTLWTVRRGEPPSLPPAAEPVVKQQHSIDYEHYVDKQLRAIVGLGLLT